jgi:acyl dehydratase
VKAYFEDCRVGDKAVTPGRTITEADLVIFAAHTGDWLPVHTDAEYAQQTRLGARIAHGLLVLSIGSALLLRLGDFAFLPQSTVALYEVERVRFHAPTKLGDTLHLEAEVSRMTELDAKRGLLVIRGLIKNHGDQTVASFVMKALVGRRPTAKGASSADRTGACDS